MFEKNLWKLMNNSFYGKTMENIRDRIRIKLLRTGEEARTMFSKPLYKDHIMFSDNLIGVLNNISSVKFDKPIYLGMTTTTTTVYFNEVVFPSLLGLTSPMAFPQHFPPPSPVPSIFPKKSLLSYIFFQHFSPSLPGPAFHSITIYLQCLNYLFPTQLISLLNMTKPPQPVSLHDFSNIINCQHAPHTLITFPFT